MTAESSSLERAVEAEGGAMIGAPASVEQLDLLRGEDGKLPSDVFRQMRAKAPTRGPGRPKGAVNKNSKQLARMLLDRGDPLLAMAETAAMPLDQFVELMMVADGSRDREERLFVLADRTQAFIDRMLDDSEAGRTLSERSVETLAGLVEQVSNLTRTLKVKPGELGLKAFVAQRDTRRIVARYIYSEMPVAVDVTTRADVILNIPGLTDAAHLAEYVDSPELSQADLNRLEYSPFEPVEDDDEDGSDDEGAGT